MAGIVGSPNQGNFGTPAGFGPDGKPLRGGFGQLTPEQLAQLTASNPRLAQLLQQMQARRTALGAQAGDTGNLMARLQQLFGQGFGGNLQQILAQIGSRFGRPGHHPGGGGPGGTPGPGGGSGGGGGGPGTHPPGGNPPPPPAPPPAPVAGLPTHAPEISTSSTPGGVKTDYVSGFGPTSGRA